MDLCRSDLQQLQRGGGEGETWCSLYVGHVAATTATVQPRDWIV